MKFNKTYSQTFILSMSNFFAMGMGFFIALLLPKYMGSHAYGVFTVSVVVLSLLSSFFEFGIFWSGAQILGGIQDKRKQRYLIHMLMVIFACLSFVCGLTVFCGTLLLYSYIQKEISEILLIGAACSCSFLCTYVVQQIARGINAIKKLSLYNVISKLVYIGIIFFLLENSCMEAKSVFLAYSISPIIAFVIVFHDLLFYKGMKYPEIKKEMIELNKKAGRFNYFGNLCSTGFGQINQLIIGKNCGVEDVGMFSIANSIGNAIYLVCGALGMSKYRDFGNFKSINSEVKRFHLLLVTTITMVCALIAYWLFSSYYGNIYEDGVNLAIVVLIASLFQGLYVVNDNWMSANGLGKHTMRLSITQGIIKLTIGVIIIPLVGVYGAAFAILFANLYYYMHSRVIYLRYKK